jgi:acetyl esterase/lipase
VQLALRSSAPVLAALLAAALLAALAAPANAEARAPMILLLHGGGWLGGTPGSMTPWKEDFRAHGYRTRIVAYPLGSVARSIRHVEAIAVEERARGDSVIAYGMSAGGSIASALAATGRVDGAVNVNGPTDFTRWVSPVGVVIMLAAQMGAHEQRAASAYWRLNGRQAPQLLQCGWADPVTTYDQCTRYVAKAALGNADTKLHATLNAHSQWLSDRDRARAWVQARWPAFDARAAVRRR